MNSKTISESELELIVTDAATDAKDYLMKYFDVKRGYKLSIVIMNLPNDLLGRFKADEDTESYRIDIDDDKLIRKLKRVNLENRFQFALDMIIGEEVGHLLFYLEHKEMHEQVLPEYYGGLKLVREVIGHYTGLVYANRNHSRPLSLSLKPDTENGKAYFLANQLYAKFKDSKLAELSKVKSLSELIGIIREYGIGENARAN